MGAYLGKSSGCPFTDRSKVGVHLCQSFLLHRPQCSAPRSICSVNHCQLLPIPRGERVRELESSRAFSCLKTKPVNVESAPSQVTYAGKSTSTPIDMRQLPRKSGKNEWKYEKAEEAADLSHATLASPRSHLYCLELV